MSKLWPSCVSYATDVQSRSERQTHSYRLVENEAQGALRSRRPADEAINSEPPNRCPAGEAINFKPPDEAANEGLITPSIGPRCLRRATSHPQRQQFRRGRPSGERIILQV